jgi:site-specific recombinase XerC
MQRACARASELVGATLAHIWRDKHGDHWLHVLGKGGKRGKVALPPLARTALDRYLVQRGLPVTHARWNPATPRDIVPSRRYQGYAEPRTQKAQSEDRAFYLILW